MSGSSDRRSSGWAGDSLFLSADKRHALADPEFRAIYRDHDAAFDWSADDPRLFGLADRTQLWLANWHDRFERGTRPVQDRTLLQLVTQSAAASSPAWHPLADMATQRKSAR
jgi:hypothetical protein